MDRLQALVALCEGKAIRNKAWWDMTLHLKEVDGVVCWVGNDYHVPTKAYRDGLANAAVLEEGYESTDTE